MPQFTRQAIGKITWNNDSADLPFTQDESRYVCVRRRFHAPFLELLHVRTQRQHPAVARVFSNAVNLEVTRDHKRSILQSKINERVWNEHADSKEHIRITLTVGHNEEIVGTHQGVGYGCIGLLASAQRPFQELPPRTWLVDDYGAKKVNPASLEFGQIHSQIDLNAFRFTLTKETEQPGKIKGFLITN